MLNNIMAVCLKGFPEVFDYVTVCEAVPLAVSGDESERVIVGVLFCFVLCFLLLVFVCVCVLCFGCVYLCIYLAIYANKYLHVSISLSISLSIIPFFVFINLSNGPLLAIRCSTNLSANLSTLPPYPALCLPPPPLSKPVQL